MESQLIPRMRVNPFPVISNRNSLRKLHGTQSTHLSGVLAWLLALGCVLCRGAAQHAVPTFANQLG